MTKMNYRLDHTRDLTVRPLTQGDLARLDRARSQKRPDKSKGWPAKYPGWCSTCRGDIPVLTLVRKNRLGKLVHANGCPQKQRRTGSE